jgi:sugar phosphate isomerase/epimerase
LRGARKLLDQNNIRVSAIGSPIGKVKIDLPFAPHLEKFKHAVELAHLFNAPFIRVFSYYPPDGKKIEEYRDEVCERIRKKADLLRGTDLVMVHENETGIYGHSAENCADLARSIDSPNFRLVYDPGNFVWGQGITNNVEVCWPLMKPYVVHVHIKDWKLGSKDVASMPGEGDGQIKQLLVELAKMRYTGFLTMEPHLKSGGQFGGDTGTELFGLAIGAFRKLCLDAGIKCD